MSYKKKLIEVALPLEAINNASAREKSIRHGHPATLHLWWARRPLAAARAVIFAQMVDDPSEHPDLFKTEKAQDKERQRLFRIIEDLVKWENTTNESVLAMARDEIWQSWRQTCAENVGHPDSKALFDRFVLPAFHDPFAGGGALPLEAQRLGLESYASDLNPVAVLINKSMIELPPKYSSHPPVNPLWQKRDLTQKAMTLWAGSQGLADDLRYYGDWMRSEAEELIGHLYPKIEISINDARNRPDLNKYIGKKLTVIAWLWTRTVKSPNPAYSSIDVPLASTFMLSTKAGKEIYVDPLLTESGYQFVVKTGTPDNITAVKNGTKLARGANFKCLMSDTPMEGSYIKSEGKAGRMGARLMAIVAEGEKERVYLSPTLEQEAIALSAQPEWRPDLTISGSSQYLGIKPYGMDRFDQLFTNRQLVALETFSNLVVKAHNKIKVDGFPIFLKNCNGDEKSAEIECTAYADAVSIYLAFAISKIANIGSSIASWMSDRGAFRETFARQAIQMTWDYAEANSFSDAGGSFSTAIDKGAKAIDYFPISASGHSIQADAATQSISLNKVISTDPPYYDNVPYADLSDFFYVWLRHSLKDFMPELFSTLAVPKTEELVAFAYRHNGKSGAEKFFLDGMTRAMHRLSEQAHPAFPVTIYYAFKQAETDIEGGTTNTGWDTFLEAVTRAGFSTTGTWPMRTEGSGRIRALGSNALASSIVLVCRKRDSAAPVANRRDFISDLKSQLPIALEHLQAGNIAPVDLAQAAIGPGMAIFTKYEKVLDADGIPISVRAALSLINQVLDECLAEQEGNFDADSRFALAWFDQHGFSDGEFGVADVLARAKATSVDGISEAGIILSGKGKVRLFKPNELPGDWNPLADGRITAWEVVHQLIRALEAGGEIAAAQLAAKLGSHAELARELCYRLYTLCERKKRANEAMSYNGLVQSWPEIIRLSRETSMASNAGNQDLFNQE